MSADGVDSIRTLWLVIVCDKELPGEPDVGLALTLGSSDDAETLGQRMAEELAAAGRGRCVYRARELEVGRGYRASALLATDRSEGWRRLGLW